MINQYFYNAFSYFSLFLRKKNLNNKKSQSTYPLFINA